MSLDIEIPTDRKIFDTHTSIGWIDDEGFMVTYSKPFENGQSLEDLKQTSAESLDFIGGKKYCFWHLSIILNQVTRNLEVIRLK